MLNHSFRYAILVSLVLIVLTALAGALTAVIITISRVPDIVVTLATSFFWAGVALEILSVPGGGAPNDYLNLGNGTFQSAWIPNEFLVIVLSFAVVWLPLRWARPGLALYAMGSNRDRAFLSGVSLGWTRILAYSVGGVFSALGGLALTASSGIGDPLSGATLTLNSVAAVVLGGVALVGGRGGILGTSPAAFVLTLTTTLLTLEGVDQNFAQVIQGALIVIVVMIGGLLLLRRRR
jgi:ribose transport system permease protein